jgi:polysaccharide pyruvyl transferase WcaK-like protein
MTRREFLLLLSALPAVAAERPVRILLRSSWQTVNIGDIAHTPGVLHLLEEYLPNAEVRLWPSSVDNGVEEMLRRRFPKLTLVQGAEAIRAAFAECDFLLHGSGPSLVAEKHVAQWRADTGKPYGVYGITLTAPKQAAIDLLSGARFAFFRDSVSLRLAKEKGCKCPVMEFGPDGAFAVDLRDDARATAFLGAHGLQEGKLLCCIPRLRNTPNRKIKPNVAFDERKHARNEAMKEHDLAPLRDAIAAVVRQTSMKVLVCPEDASQMEIGKEMLVDRLPADVKPGVVWRKDYWLTDEALSTYVRSAGLFGAEMHSPIMCIGNGIPAIVCRWQEQTSKGLMWRDIGLGEWLFNMDEESEIPGIVPAVLALAKDPAAAQAKANRAREVVRQRQRETMAVLAQTVAG